MASIQEIVLDPEVLRGFGFLLASVLSYFVARWALIKVVHNVSRKTRSDWDDVLVQMKVFTTLALIVPALVLYYGAKTHLSGHEELVFQALSIYLTLITVLLLGRLLNGALAIYNKYPVASRRPMKGYVQLTKIFISITGGVVILAVLVGISPWKLVSGIGALTAVVLLIFKDTILSFVASIQIAGNDLLRKGDWIEMAQFGADGDVIDIALHTIKVQNWDKTVVSIPTYKLLENPFKNWRGMQEAGGRRIKRSVLIDQSSIRFMDEKLLARAEKIALLRDYLAAKEREIQDYNTRLGVEPGDGLNGRRLTNIGTLRAYVKMYLKQHPRIRQDMTQLVRHLQPQADSGLPLEVYAFTTETAWDAYEDIQADILDHILAVIPEFGLRTYQRNAMRDTRCTDTANIRQVN